MVELQRITCTSGGSPLTLESRSTAVAGGVVIEITLPRNLSGPISLDGCELFYSFDEAALGCFKNGFQSWSASREYSPYEHDTLLGPLVRAVKLHRFGDDHFLRPLIKGWCDRPGRFVSHTYTYLRHTADSITLAGSVDESPGYTLFSVDLPGRTLIVSKDVEGGLFSAGDLLLSLLICGGTEEDCFSQYWETAAARAGSPPLAVSAGPSPDILPTGWTSWYNYYTEISEEILLANIDALEDAGAPLDYFQIDDGYQEAVGDWLRIKNSFPRGMKHLADRARTAGFTPGLWLAPFICERRSTLARENPEWILTDRRGRRVPAGWNPGWSGTFYALDTENPDLLDHLRGVFETVLKDWGYEMVKLDFLYAAGMVPRNGKTRGRLMCEAMEFVRSCAGEKTILGCGVPLGSAFFQADICRIGSDVALEWEDGLLRRLRYPERVSTVNSLTATVGRRQMGMGWSAPGTDAPDTGNHPRPFLADPDVFILRSRGVALTPAERYTLFLLNALFGQLLFTSDDVSRYTPEERELFLSLFPFREKKFESVRTSGGVTAAAFSLRENRYRVYANLADRPVRFVLPPTYPRAQSPDCYFRARTFEGRPDPVFAAEGDSVELEGHESLCFLAVPNEDYAVAGSTGNLFPGSEITGIVASRGTLDIELHPHTRNRGEVFIRVPGPGKYIVNGLETEAYEPHPQTWIVRTVP